MIPLLTFLVSQPYGAISKLELPFELCSLGANVGELMYVTNLKPTFIRNGIKVVIGGRIQICLQHSAQHPLPQVQHAPSPSFPKTFTSSAVACRKVTRIPESALSHRWETPIPTTSQLRQAERFFLSHPPVHLYSSQQFRTIEAGTVPEVAFLGRSNVGKSSLLNSLMGRNICHTSSKAGRTRTMNFFAVGGADQAGNPGKLVVLDMPGYGHGSREEWGLEIMKYLVGRKQYVYLHLA